MGGVGNGDQTKLKTSGQSVKFWIMGKKSENRLITGEFTVIYLKKSWQMDMNGWKLGVGQLIREYWDVNCGNYFYLNSN